MSDIKDLVIKHGDVFSALRHCLEQLAAKDAQLKVAIEALKKIANGDSFMYRCLIAAEVLKHLGVEDV